MALYANDSLHPRRTGALSDKDRSHAVNKYRFITAVKFAAGALTGLAMHELSHLAMLEQGDHQREYELPDTFVYDEPSNRVQFAGFAGQIISTELILLKKERTPFYYGWLGWNLSNEFYYPIRTFYINPRGGDLGRDNTSRRSRKRVSILLVSHALLTSWRLWRDDDFRKHVDLFIDPINKEAQVGFKFSF